ncbi:MAG: PIN domain-containing protein [Acidimicrobiia bacterium]
MTVLDAFAVLALLKDEPAAAKVATLVETEPRPALTALGVAEVLDHLVRLMGVDEEEAVLDLAQLGLAEAHGIDGDIAGRSGRLRARHYHRRDRAISLADCVAAEVARRVSAPLATSDPHLLDTCHAEGIPYVVLPDARGAVWTP